jgi:hypothetical protein
MTSTDKDRQHETTWAVRATLSSLEKNKKRVPILDMGVAPIFGTTLQCRFLALAPFLSICARQTPTKRRGEEKEWEHLFWDKGGYCS